MDFFNHILHLYAANVFGFCVDHITLTRTNFFNYTYILCQLCVLLDQHQYLPYIPMMKDRIKQLEQDMIWKKVCEYLDWEYFPTV